MLSLDDLPGIRGVFKELPFVREDNQSDLSIAQDRDLMSFLQQPTSPFGEGNLPVDLVLYPLHLNPTSPHLSFLFLTSKKEIPRAHQNKQTQILKLKRNKEDRVNTQVGNPFLFPLSLVC